MANLIRSFLSAIIAIIMFIIMLSAIQRHEVVWAIAAGGLCLFQCYLAGSRLLMVLLSKD